MQPVTRSKRPLPGADAERGERRGEFLAVVATSQIDPLLAGAMAKHRGIADVLWRSAGHQPGLGSENIGLQMPAMALRIEHHLFERNAGGSGIPVRMRHQIRGEFRVGWRSDRARLLAHDRELLEHATTDHRIVAIEAQRQPLTEEHLLVDVGIDEPTELDRGRRPLPCALEAIGQRRDRCRRYDETVSCDRFVGSDAIIEQENRESRRQKMQQGFPVPGAAPTFTTSRIGSTAARRVIWHLREIPRRPVSMESDVRHRVAQVGCPGHHTPRHTYSRRSSRTGAEASRIEGSSVSSWGVTCSIVIRKFAVQCLQGRAGDHFRDRHDNARQTPGNARQPVGTSNEIPARIVHVALPGKRHDLTAIHAEVQR